MSDFNKPLNRSQVQTLALKLESEFGSSDRVRLQKLIDLVREDGTLPYHLALEVIVPGKTRTTAQADLRAFRLRLATACADAKLGDFCLNADGKKKSRIEERCLWFSGDDVIQQQLATFAQELVRDDYTNYRSENYVEQSVAIDSVQEANGKPHITVFVSYVHENSRDKNLLIDAVNQVRQTDKHFVVWSDTEIIAG